MTELSAWTRVESMTPASAAFIIDINPDTTPVTKSILASDALVSMMAAVTDITAAGTVTAKAFSNPNSGASLGTGNEAFGSGALDAVETGGNYNSAFGLNSLGKVTSGDSNTAFGWNTGSNIVSASNNTLIGSCGSSLTSGSNNVAIGNNGLAYSVAGLQSVAIGYAAGQGSSGLSDVSYCVLVGYEAGKLLRTANTYIVAVGHGALKACTTGANNVAVGGKSLTACTTGYSNIGVGYQSLEALTTGASNVAVGYQSQLIVTDEVQNTSLGSHAAVYCMGSYNTYLGYSAGACQDQGQYNTAIGRHALYGSYNVANSPPVDSQDSSYNVAIGYDALTICAGGDNNIGIGYQCGDNLTTGSRNILIGSGVDASAAGVDDELNIGGLIKGDLSATQKIGFFGVTPVVKQTSADWTTLANLVTALKNLGLIGDP